MLKMATEPENKHKYIKLSKHLIVATVFITISLTLIDIPKNYYGSKVEIVDSQVAEVTIEKIRDDDCQGRECVYVDGRWFVVTDENVEVRSFWGMKFMYDKFGTYGVYMNDPYEALYNVDVLRKFSESQGMFKGFYAEIHFYREEDGFIFPAWYKYDEYTSAKQEYLKNLEANPNE